MTHAVRLLPVDRVVRVPRGTTLLDAVAAAGLPLARACSGSALCARCGLRVLRGGETLAPESDAEQSAKRRNRVPAELRLACCARVTSDLTVTAAYW